MFGFNQLVLVLGIVLSLVPLAAAIDVARLPKHAWEAMGLNKGFWLGLLVVGVFVVGIGWTFAVVYFLNVRPKVAPEARDPDRPTLTP